MASRLSNEAWSKGLDAGTVHTVYIVIAEVQNASVAYFQIKIQLFGFSAYLNGLSSQFNRLYVVLLYFERVVTACTVIIIYKPCIIFFPSHSPSTIETCLWRTVSLLTQLAAGVLPRISKSNFRFLLVEVGFTLITSVLANLYHSTKAPYSYFIHLPLMLYAVNQLRALLKKTLVNLDCG
jgi:hypothetical protein